MEEHSDSNIIKENPIGSGLSAFLDEFKSTCRDPTCKLQAVDQLGVDDLQNLVFILLSTLQILPAARLLPTRIGNGTLRGDLSRLNTSITSNNFDLNRAKPLLKAALADKLDDELIWRQVSNLAIEDTPPPRSIASSLQQTPWLHNTSSFANSSEHRRYVDDVLKEELGTML
ncbi:hypothetical protein CGMCC3_g17198 [Colletotrichum fructicola]|uniref:Uncharacterized protein n=1 Tax=Colletotrichum fructicola (strain Nara gc5) TaxID=1213859 RepID=A0A7J6IE11_COLFN|nr:uncharacterized protein CGMCC3_g17198 [Colletotrichum fructicola]KAE9566671.1 hypothetical protein CGMCC3_g17198 [Colletotrichum fructicola]KAF4474100.1 hypothetical protein CGGC5_v016997 [Colletotrichum fructicola Nara gc5]